MSFVGIGFELVGILNLAFDGDEDVVAIYMGMGTSLLLCGVPMWSIGNNKQRSGRSQVEKACEVHNNCGAYSYNSTKSKASLSFGAFNNGTIGFALNF